MIALIAAVQAGVRGGRLCYEEITTKTKGSQTVFTLVPKQ